MIFLLMMKQQARRKCLVCCPIWMATKFIENRGMALNFISWRACLTDNAVILSDSSHYWLLLCLTKSYSARISFKESYYISQSWETNIQFFHAMDIIYIRFPCEKKTDTDVYNVNVVHRLPWKVIRQNKLNIIMFPTKAYQGCRIISLNRITNSIVFNYYCLINK